MNMSIVLGISVLLKFLAATLALRLIWVTGKKWAWILIAGAISLMAVRRSITITRLISGDISYSPDLTAEVVALIISVLMVVGISLIAPLFHKTKKSEEALQESEKRYRKLIDTANDAIFLADAENGIILDANKQAGKLLGIPAEKIIGMHQTQLHPKEEAEYYEKIFKDYIELGKAITETMFVAHKDGHKIPVEITLHTTSTITHPPILHTTSTITH
ncbi:MAG: PAS domain S-box protein, partial [Candidatus Mariimomonas ferrooxydans]